MKASPLRTLYCVQIVERKNWPAGNNAWAVGSYLYWRPEQYEDCFGPGGFACYDSTELLNNADFFERLSAAENAVKWMADRHKDIVCKIIFFKEVKGLK